MVGGCYEKKEVALKLLCLCPGSLEVGSMELLHSASHGSNSMLPTSSEPGQRQRSFKATSFFS